MNKYVQPLITAEIDSTWILYYKQESTDGPTSFHSEVQYKDNISIKEQMRNISVPITTYDNIFEMEVIQFKNEAIFKQRVTILDPQKTATIKIYWEYMICNQERCLPPTERCAKVDIKPINPQIKTMRVGKSYIVDCND